MKIYNSTDFLDQCKNKTIFLDTNVLIGLVSIPPLEEFIISLKTQGNSLLTIPAVFFEFVRGADSISKFKKRSEIFDPSVLIDAIYPIERHFEEMKEYILIFQKIAPKMSFSDFLLALCLAKFSDAYLLTENHLDFPVAIFDRKNVFTVDSDKQLRNYGLYQLSSEKFNKAAASIVSELD